jgi:sugar O-acyltransferase (sialic acid O-acetyltransferase NeuD family)
MKNIIYGNGAMAKILYSYIRSDKNVCGFTVDDISINNNSNSFCGLPLIPFNSVEKIFSPSEYTITIAVGFIDMNELRNKKYNEAKSKGYSIGTYVHPSVMIHDDVSIGENCIILDYVSIHPGCRIGNNTFISSNVNVGHDCIVGPSNWINGGVMIAGGCDIGQCCFFGVNSSVGHGVRIGARNFIAANTLINKDTKDDGVYVSEPGQLFRLKSKSFLKFCKMMN